MFAIGVALGQVSADECGSICELVPGSCSENGSHCHNEDACMDLFWFDDAKSIICNLNHTGCSDRTPLLCSEAIAIQVGEWNFPSLPGESSNPIPPVEIEDVPMPPRSVIQDNPPVHRGIRNLGASCYFNSVLEVLGHSTAVRRLFVESGVSDSAHDSATKVAYAFESFLNEMSQPEAEPLNTRELLASVRHFAQTDGLEEGVADDASTVAGYLISALTQSIPLGQEVFTVQGRVQSKCLGCAYQGLSYDTWFAPIPIQVPEISQDESVALSSLISNLFAKNVPESFACRGCSLKGSIAFSPVVTAAPELLIFTLSRVLPNGEKNMASIAIHDSINLAALADTHIPASELQYTLTGVVRHAGGHFTADFLEESQWYHADDAVVAPIDSPVKIGPEPYILVYQRSF